MTKKYALYKYPYFLFDRDKQHKLKKSQTGGKTHNNADNDASSFINNEYQQYCWDYPYTPAILPAAKRIVAFGDIHGDYNLAIKLLIIAGVIQITNDNIKWIGGMTHVVQIGDQIDRCRPMGNMRCDQENTTYQDEASDTRILELFTNLDMQARKDGGMVVSLLGNHELMNVMGNFDYVSYENMKQFDNYVDENQPDKQFNSARDARKYAFSSEGKYGRLLGCTRLPAVIIGSNLFVHAGIIDKLIKKLELDEQNDLEKINIAIKRWLLGLVQQKDVDYLTTGKNSMFWTRILGSIPPDVNIKDESCSTHVTKVLKLFKINHMFIGHTPQSFLYRSGINSTCSNVVWRCDNGSSDAFAKFDFELMSSGKPDNNRIPQAVEIINDNQFNILS